MRGPWEAGRARLEAKPSGSAFRLSGAKRLVLDGAVAERFFVVARVGQGLGLFAVDAGAAGFSIEGQEAFDRTRSLARLRFENVEVTAVGAPGEDAVGIERGLEDAMVLLCAEMVGGMQRVLESAVDYANARYQFGRPIGSFQAIKHKCADMLIELEGARTAVEAAIEACDDGEGARAAEDASERSLLAAVAKAHCGPAFVHTAIENMQIQGGVGYTWEYDAHLYYRRAQASEVFFGPASEQHDRIARLLASSGRGAQGSVGGRTSNGVSGAAAARGHAG